MYVKLQSKLTAKESIENIYQIVQNKYCLPLAECLLVHPGWFKRHFSLFAIRGIFHSKRRSAVSFACNFTYIFGSVV